MKILCVGDIVGKSGRQVVQEYLPKLKKELDIDFIIANGENAAHGKGITKKIYESLLNYGVNVITLGNHTFSKDNIFKFIDEAQFLVRPMNLKPIQYGKSTVIVSVNNKRIAVSNLCGEVFMTQIEKSPFIAMQEILSSYQADIHIVDFHAETTSEKIAFAHFFKDKIQAIVGTHTHVQTADERILGKCAFISDIGMCGAYHSVIGRDVEEVLRRFTKNEKTRFTIAEGPAIFCAVLITFDDNTNEPLNIERIQIRPY